MLPVGIAPTTRRFEAGRSDLLSYGSLLKWCAQAVLPHLPPQCRCGDLLLIYRRECRALCAAMKWRPRMDSHHQPPDSKSGALLVELQGYRGTACPCPRTAQNCGVRLRNALCASINEGVGLHFVCFGGRIGLP